MLRCYVSFPTKLLCFVGNEALAIISPTYRKVTSKSPYFCPKK